MGKDEHKKKVGKNFLAQTPEYEKADGIDVEFASELADANDIEAKNRSERADKRAKKNLEQK